MKTVLRLELIADNLYQYERLRRASKITQDLPLRRELELLRFAHKSLKPWVARLTGLSDWGFEREFVRCTKDYSDANSIGSRGVYGYFVLSSGVYEINERLNWKRARRYFVRVEGETITEISRDEVLRCLSAA